MNEKQIDLVQASFEMVRPIADQAAETFYQRLFEIAPHYRSLFKHDMKKQGAMLMSTLGLAVGSLKNLETILPAVRALGKRHAGYGVTAEHYQPVAEAFLWTLEYYLGEDFTPELKEAWVAAYMTLAGAMIAAAEEEAIPA
ncbi:MAG: globin domain-containing protein [Anaerolineae bacterium]|nr:globin domain-containing protein [Anaerolineae bacterium]MCI0609618.1 globin domain-containing protein [Anaerolineae bacterium]